MIRKLNHKTKMLLREDPWPVELFRNFKAEGKDLKVLG
jgi:hypothetical protein